MINETGVAEDGKMDSIAQCDVHQGISTLMAAVHNIALTHGWWETERNFGEMIALMHSELSEALEAYRDNDNPKEIRYQYTDGAVLYAPQFHYADGLTELGKPVGIASEFADVIIRIADTCQQAGIPLAEAIIRKTEYNRIRPYRHGGKAC